MQLFRIAPDGKIEYTESIKGADGIVQEKVETIVYDRIRELLKENTESSIAQAQALLEKFVLQYRLQFEKGVADTDGARPLSNYGIDKAGNIVGFDISHLRPVFEIDVKETVWDVHLAATSALEDLKQVNKKGAERLIAHFRNLSNANLLDLKDINLPASENEMKARAAETAALQELRHAALSGDVSARRNAIEKLLKDISNQ